VHSHLKLKGPRSVVTRTSFTPLDDTGEAQQRAWSPLVCAHSRPAGRWELGPTGADPAAAFLRTAKRRRSYAERLADSTTRRMNSDLPSV
jgi:hypothetical protein